jgi:hypothetical protein
MTIVRARTLLASTVGLEAVNMSRTARIVTSCLRYLQGFGYDYIGWAQRVNKRFQNGPAVVPLLQERIRSALLADG